MSRTIKTSRFQEKIDFFTKLKKEDENKEDFLRSTYQAPFSPGNKSNVSQRSELKNGKSAVILGRRKIRDKP